MAERTPRPSTDQESAPLLRDPETEGEETNNSNASSGFTQKLSAIAHEPLTPLSKLLLFLALILLLLSSVFIGLFAGTQHKLNKEHQKHNNDGGHSLPITSTVTATRIATSTSVSTTTAAPVPAPTGPPKQDVCLTPECILLSASIISSLDTSQDPCNNFYEYANGGWLKAHPVPGDKGSYGSFEALAQANGLVIRRILESNDTVSSLSPDAGLLRKLRSLYSSCMDEKALDNIGTEPLLKVVQTIRTLYKGETVQNELKDKTKGLTSAIAFMHSRGIDGLFSFVIDGDALEPNDMSLWFYQPELGLPSKEYYEEEPILEVYRDVLERLLFALSEGEDELVQQKPSSKLIDQASNWWPPFPWPPWDRDGDGNHDGDEGKTPVDRRWEAKRLAKKVVKFETRIAKATLDLDVLQEDPKATYNPAPISNLTSGLGDHINFNEYIATFAPRTYPSSVILTYPPYVHSLNHILSTTPSDVIEAFLITRAALNLAPYLGMGTEAWKAQRSLQETLRGLKKGAVGDRGEWCAVRVENALGFASGRFFVQETFGGDSRKKATKVITDIVAAFKKSLKHVEWMDDKSAKAAAEKADAIRVKVGYPVSPDTTNPMALHRYYSQVQIKDDQFFENMLSAARSDEIKKWIQLGRQRNKDAWDMFPSTVNAYFNPLANEIVFPAGILQPPFFSQDWPSYLAYGAFGQVASHELTHAFDSAGRLYDQEGRLKEWWTNATSAGFQVKKDCIVKQYSAYTIDDGKGGKVHVNGNLTSGENIGDSGIIQAYRAWKAQDSSEMNDYVLPGLNYTKDQLFFIAFGRIWARNMKPAAALQRVRTDPHSPTQYRVEGTLSNIAEFAEAFNCPKGSKLNPPDEERCVFW